MFEVDASTSILANNDLQLIIPTVGTCADLDAPLDLTGTAQHVHAQVGTSLWLGVIQAEYEKRRVDNVQTVGVVGPVFAMENIAQASPRLSVFCAQHTQCSLCRILNGHFLRVVDNDRQVEGNVLFTHDKVVIIVKNIEPIELAVAHDHNMLRGWVLTNLASIFGGYPSSAKQSGVLVHAEWLAPNGIRRQLLSTYSSYKRQCRYH
jgi:hypothetical protein